MTSAETPYGLLLKKTRLAKRPEPWTQYRLHIASKVSESEICQIERGDRKPQDITKAKLAAALEAPELGP